MQKKDGKYVVDPHFEHGVTWESIGRRVPAKVEGHKPKTDTRICNQGFNCWCWKCPILECIDGVGVSKRNEILRGMR